MGEELQTVRTSVEAQTLYVTISRPQALNALNSAVLSSLCEVFEKEPAKDLRVVVVSGEGEKSFVAGADIAEMDKLSSEEIARYVELGHRAMQAISRFPLPVIAAVNGFALGGGLELALACDFILCKEGAKLGLPEINLGILPGFGGTQRLTQRLTLAQARRLILSGLPVGADEALQMGLVDFVFKKEEFEQSVHSYANQFAAKAPLALKEAKQLFSNTHSKQLGVGLDEEKKTFLKLFASQDRCEGMGAFLEKRTAKFQGS